MTISKATKHAIIDREDRIMKILLTVGFGEVIDKKPHELYSDRYYEVTSTGVLLLKGRDDALITAWVINFSKASAMYGGDIPQWLKIAIKKNVKIHLV